MTYAIIKCPHCKKLFIKEIRSKKTLERSITCKICGKNFKIISKKYGNTIIKTFEDIRVAQVYLRKLTEEYYRK
ncbi:hypothetical protein BA065_02180 [Nanoarchaeota archaeon NZ13-N]|uniref:Uncharacterized protein n=1 Tax=Candidatus Nanoclepta minutus TaxID=1940235 RepID=A0A397WNK6_9ARCH|nr:MAG: hypothetical protein BA065_02180 [Nanoarchaeota archaeon NZ13-N]RIB35167.1 MAG: hypothetical protein BXU00_02435 [Candidatus Nanoclepta minutus]